MLQRADRYVADVEASLVALSVDDRHSVYLRLALAYEALRDLEHRCMQRCGALAGEKALEPDEAVGLEVVDVLLRETALEAEIGDGDHAVRARILGRRRIERL